MEVLHGIYDLSHHKICLWQEAKKKLSKPEQLILKGKGGTAQLMLPTHNSLPVSSPLMTREYNIEVPSEINLQSHNVKCLYVDVVDIKKLESTEKLVFAQDLLFWTRMLDFVSEILEYHLYIPSIQGDNTTTWTTYHPDIEQLSLQMPDICSYISGNYYDKAQILQHFFDYTVTYVAKRTPLSQVQEKNIASTLLEKFFSGSKNKITKSEKSNWLIWKSALDKSKHDICIKIDAPEHKNDNWLITVLAKDEDDQSKQTPIHGNWQNHINDLGLAMRIYPNLENAFDQDKIVPFELSQLEAKEFLSETAWFLQQSGFPVIIPSWYTPKGHNSAKLKLKRKNSLGSSQNENSYFTAEGLMSFKYALSLNGEELSVKEWRELIENKEELVQFRGEWVQLDLENMSKILDFWNSNQAEDMNIFGLLDKASNPDIELDGDTDEFVMSLYGKQNLEIEETPESFVGTLRPYQKLGFSWMRYMEKLGLNPCLADDMGLGKTIQIIALIAGSISGKNLLVVPTSVIGNWEREFAKFAPSIKVKTYHSKDKDNSIFEKSDVVVLTTFNIMRKHYKLFDKTKWHRIIIDEAQNIKNPKAKQSKALFALNSKYQIALTGTPIENSVVDLWSIFNFLNRDYLGDVKRFKKAFHNNPNNRPQLKRLVEPFLLRRLKTDKSIITELPNKIEQNIYCQLTKEQASLYQAVVNQLAADMKKEELKSSAMLSSLTRLKQICNHPAQYLQDNSEFAEKRSLKLQRLMSIVDEAIENEESVLIFSQYKEICVAINKMLATKYNVYLLHGGTSRSARDSMIAEFQDSGTPPSIFTLSLKAGGVGITLTKASQVIHFDRWWNPAVENQATDRAFRIGQQKKVLVHKFITQGTLEEKIDQMIADKSSLSESILSDDSSWLKGLNTQSFMDLVKLREEALSGE
ncbi:DEAD/DEAH box helicase [Rickettsiaceae bacterium]|nr:DEAD/DEAH box helicase [Rickettsiaceae bacterium]